MQKMLQTLSIWQLILAAVCGTCKAAPLLTYSLKMRGASYGITSFNIYLTLQPLQAGLDFPARATAVDSSRSNFVYEGNAYRFTSLASVDMRGAPRDNIVAKTTFPFFPFTASNALYPWPAGLAFTSDCSDCLEFILLANSYPLLEDSESLVIMQTSEEGKVGGWFSSTKGDRNYIAVTFDPVAPVDQCASLNCPYRAPPSPPPSPSPPPPSPPPRPPAPVALPPIADGLTACYFAESYDAPSKVWRDLSTLKNHVLSTSFTGAITTATETKGYQSLTGTKSSSIRFPTTINNLPASPAITPANYTLFHVTRYNSTTGARGRLMDAANGYNWFSGHHSGKSGVAYHGQWITPQVDRHGASWVISTDAPSLYRAQGITRSNLKDAATSKFSQLTINGGTFNQLSDWRIAALLFYKRTLTLEEIGQVERFLSAKYGICLLNSAQVCKD